jgi:hypothetical protein
MSRPGIEPGRSGKEPIEQLVYSYLEHLQNHIQTVASFCIFPSFIFPNLEETICEYLEKILPLDGDNLSTAATAAAAAAVTAAVAAGVGCGFLGGRAEAQADPEMEVTEIILAKIYRFCQLLSHSRGVFARV